MKKIEAFIRHEAFDPIRAELLDKGLPSLSIAEVKGSVEEAIRIRTGEDGEPVLQAHDPSA